MIMAAAALHPPGRITRFVRWLFANRLPDFPSPPEQTAADLALAPLFAEAAEEDSELVALRRNVPLGKRLHVLPKFVKIGETSGTHSVRVGIFAGLDARSLDTVLGAARLLYQSEREPALIRDYLLAVYPKANVGAFDTRPQTLDDMQARAERSPDDADIRYLRDELNTARFALVIRYRSTPGETHFRATVRGDLIARTVVAPALGVVAGRYPIADEAVQTLPQFRAARAIARHNCLAPSSNTHGGVEIELFAPSTIPSEERAAALAEITFAILEKYRALVSFQAML